MEGDVARARGRAARRATILLRIHLACPPLLPRGCTLLRVLHVRLDVMRLQIGAECVQAGRRGAEVLRWLPRVVGGGQALPAYPILELAVDSAMVHDVGELVQLAADDSGYEVGARVRFEL